MRSPEDRVVIEDLRKYPQTLRSTAVRRKEVGAWISTIYFLPMKPNVGVIETLTSRISGVEIGGKGGREGKERTLYPGRIIPLMPFSSQFSLGHEEEALEYHVKVIDAVASLLEEDPSQLERLEQEELNY